MEKEATAILMTCDTKKRERAVLRAERNKELNERGVIDGKK